MDFDITCPHCGYHDDGAYEVLPDFADDWTETDCARCEKSYKVKWNAYFTTAKVEENDKRRNA